MVEMLTLFTIENEKQNETSFLDKQSISQNKKISISVYGKLTFCGVYTHFDSFLKSTYMMVLFAHLLVNASIYA